MPKITVSSLGKSREKREKRDTFKTKRKREKIARVAADPTDLEVFQRREIA